MSRKPLGKRFCNHCEQELNLSKFRLDHGWKFANNCMECELEIKRLKAYILADGCVNPKNIEMIEGKKVGKEQIENNKKIPLKKRFAEPKSYKDYLEEEKRKAEDRKWALLRKRG